MKKYAKLLCSILVIVALCTSLLFTTGAEESEPFVKSFEATDYSGGQNINNGTTIAKSDVPGNRVNSISTMNVGNSNFVSIAQGNGSDNHIVAYANKTINETYASGNNLAISVGTANSDPFTVVGEDAKGYYVIDFDIATYGNFIPNVDVSVVLRRASDTSGFPFSDEIVIGNYLTAGDSWSHITLIGDIANNVIKVFVNGEFVANGPLAVRNDPDADKLANDTQVKALGYRVEFTRNNVNANMTAGDNTAFDNFAHRLYIDDSEALELAINSGSLTSWEGYTAGRGGEKLPVLATIEDNEYRNFKDLERGISTNDTVNVEFLAQPFAPISFCVNANVNTNGMEQSKLFTPVNGCQIVSVNGNIVSTTAPFVSNVTQSHVAPTSAPNIIKLPHADNVFSEFQAINYDKSGGRTMYVVSDSYTNSTYINERVHSGIVNDSSNTYNDWFPSGKKITYVTGVDQHIVVDFDIAMNSSDTPYLLKTITRTSASGSAWSGNNDISLNTLYQGYELGEFVHITMVLSTDTKDTTVFVNGKYVLTKDDNITDNTDHYFQAIRGGGNSSADVSYTNISMRVYQDSAITAAVANRNIALWSGNLYNADYKMPSQPSIAAVDGVAYHSEEALETVLYGNKTTPAVVKILHAFSETITVNCDAVIYTYGQDVKFVDINGRDLTPNQNGIITLDIPYMEVRAEEQVPVTGGSNLSAVFNAVNANVNGNLFNAFVPTVGNWGAAGYRNASLITDIDSGSIVYRESAILNSEGGLNTDSAEQVSLRFTPVSMVYEPGRASYIVVDFDFGTDGALIDDIAVGLVPVSGASVSDNAILLNNLGMIDGDMAHVTIVFDFTNNCAYAFVNGLFACSAEGGAIDNNEAYLAGTELKVDSFSFFTEDKLSTVCFDNVAVRTFSYATAEDALIGTIDSGDITDWADSIYTADYRASKLPTLAVVDGREYGSIDTLNKILAIETNYVKTVEVKYIPATAVKIRSEATVETNGLNLNLDWNTGLYEFDPGIERYKGTRTGLAYASTKFIYTTVGTAYTFKTINADNCWSNSSVAIWTYKISNPGSTITFHDYDVVFYPYGEKMEPIVNGVYIQNGVLNRVTWYKVTVTSSKNYSISSVTDYPVASPTEEMKIYTAKPRTENINYAATDMLCSANISTSIDFKFFVKKTKYVDGVLVSAVDTDTGETAVINGEEYVVFRYELAPHEIDKVITVTFQVRSGAALYTQKQEICFVDYLRRLLETDAADKSLIVSLLNYANEAHALFDANGEKMSSVTALIEEYSEYLPSEELTEKLDTSALSSVIRSAALRLNSVPEFVFKIARGFRGTVTLSYNRFGETVEYSVYVNSLASEQILTLKGLGIFDVANDITITVTAHGSDDSVVCQYNLATYAQSLEDNAFAVALYNYSKLALQYHTENDTSYPA